uniref:AB hydrolase-1 domain-containing protein n=1 Tax=Ananas comosus var. bracteatus TaxID=296719 RepID=A0A6V7NWK3_ANACO|nr:unnamed protein product [Ananas comosus var. bracteatus]
MTVATKKVSAASARAHTRKHTPSSSSSGTFKKLSLVLLVASAALTYQAIQPPPPRICGSPNGPPIASTRIKLKDGRHLAYLESGVPKEQAKHKIIFIHGFDSCRYDAMQISSVLNCSPSLFLEKLLPALGAQCHLVHCLAIRPLSLLILRSQPSNQVLEEFGIYYLSFDRPGYGESDPHPKKSAKSIAFDIEELADQLGLGPKFYVVGFSMGGEIVWSCLKYIPHRLAGAALLAPVANYWWDGFPSNLSKEAYNQQLPQDKWAVGVAHYAPWLTYWWNTRKWFPGSSVIAVRFDIFSDEDKKILPKLAARGPYMAQIRQQGEFESLHRDMMKLPWVHYHELPTAGHMFPAADGMADVIVKELLTKD